MSRPPAIVLTDTSDPLEIIDRVLRATAILNAYTRSVPDERSDERYVLWTVRDILEHVTHDIERIPVREAVS
jgi:hypothetical protein